MFSAAVGASTAARAATFELVLMRSARWRPLLKMRILLRQHVLRVKGGRCNILVPTANADLDKAFTHV